MIKNEYQLIQNYLIDSGNEVFQEPKDKSPLPDNPFSSLFNSQNNFLQKFIQIEITIALMIPLLRLFIHQNQYASIISRETMKKSHQYLIISLIAMFLLIFTYLNDSFDKVVLEVTTFVFIIIHFLLYYLDNKSTKASNELA